MLDRIRDKMNKFSAITYDATKTWLTQLLDSGETDFLTGFITLVFEKAAAEPPFCALYARLLTELRASFPHLDTELRRLFVDFLDVFTLAASEPDITSAEYAAFLQLRERRKYRRGYASFLGVIASLGVLTAEDILRTCGIILDGLEIAKKQEGAGLLCEEYADCLGTLFKGCKNLVESDAAGCGALVGRIATAQIRSPSLTNKARFALMDLTDMFPASVSSVSSVA
jgi:hypothetical protein